MFIYWLIGKCSASSARGQVSQRYDGQLEWNSSEHAQVVVTERGISDSVIKNRQPTRVHHQPSLVDKLFNRPNSKVCWRHDITGKPQSSPFLLQSELDHIADWCDVNDLLINTIKTKVITFINLTDNPHPHQFLAIRHQQLKRVQKYKYLGTTIASKLSFSQNTTLMTVKLRKTSLYYDQTSLSRCQWVAMPNRIHIFHWKLSDFPPYLQASQQMTWRCWTPVW